MKPGRLYSAQRVGLPVMVFCLAENHYIVFWPEDHQMKRGPGFDSTNDMRQFDAIAPLYTFSAQPSWTRRWVEHLRNGNTESLDVARELERQLPQGPEEPKNPGAVVALIPHGIAVRTDEGLWSSGGKEEAWAYLDVAMILSPGWEGDNATKEEW